MVPGVGLKLRQSSLLNAFEVKQVNKRPLKNDGCRV